MRIIVCALLLILALVLPVWAEPVPVPIPTAQIGMSQCVIMEPAVMQVESDASVIDQLLGMFGKLEVKTLITYNFDDAGLCLAEAAIYPIAEWGNITFNADALLISGRDGLTFALGPGLTISKIGSMLDITVAWSPQAKWNIGFGINF